MTGTFGQIDPGFLAPPAGGFTSRGDVNQARTALSQVVPQGLFQEWFDATHGISPQQKANQRATLASSGSLNQSTRTVAGVKLDGQTLLMAAVVAGLGWVAWRAFS